MKKIVAVVGDSGIENDRTKYQTAFETGKALIQNGFRVLTGGMGGVMEAALAGARAADDYREGDTIAILPSFDSDNANVYADIIIPTGLDLSRNVIVANADAVVAIGGGAGTLSEIAMAWSLFRLIVAYDNVEGWGARLAGSRLDARERYVGADDKIFAVSTVQECMSCLNEKMSFYSRRHHGIQNRKR